MFLLHGNVRDLIPWEDDDGSVRWLDLRTYLVEFLARSRDVIACYDVSTGLQFPKKGHRQRFLASTHVARTLRGELPLDELPSQPLPVLRALEDALGDEGSASGIVIDYLPMIAPQADPAFMSPDDKSALVTLRRWSTEPRLLATDNLIVLIAEHLTDVSRSLVSSAQLVTLRLDFPEEPLRNTFIDQHMDGVPSQVSAAEFAKITAGLTLVQVRGILRVAEQSGQPIRFQSVSARKKQLIEQECHGLVEFVEPDHDLSHVGGIDGVKEVLNQVAEAVKAGKKAQVPMGMIFVGPMGTGKTFVAEAFAADSGLTCLKFKNFRDRWVGSTEANLEKVLGLVEALGYVLLIIDEADRALSAGDNDGGVGSRVIARLKQFMSDTSHRGRVVMLMMTNRPDKLDVDLKRPGRFDLKIPFFFPETAEQRLAMLEAQVRRKGLSLHDDVDLMQVAEATQGYSAAELEAVLVAAIGQAAWSDRDVLHQEDLDFATTDVIPSRDVRMLEFMELQAVFECSTRRMLPERFQELTTQDVLAQLDVLRAALGRRAR